MPTFHEIDPATPFRQQLEADTGPIVITNTYTVPEGHMDETIATWGKAARIGSKQPGYISAQIHRGIAGSNQLIIYSEWSAARHLKDYLNLPEVKALVATFPSGTECRPHVWQKISIDGVCDGDS
jgi:heme-degrading monooxygenase HmoA